MNAAHKVETSTFFEVFLCLLFAAFVVAPVSGQAPANHTKKHPVGIGNASQSNAGQSVIDSLMALLNGTDNAHEARRVALLNELTVEHFYVSLEQAAVYQEQAAALAQRIRDITGLATAVLNKGFLERLANKYQTALENSNKALAMFQRVQDKRGIARALYHIGLVQQARAEYLSSRLSYLQSLSITETIGDVFQTARTLNAISEDYFDQGDVAKALDYGLRSLDLHRQYSDKRWIALQMDNVGFMYERAGEPVKALEYYMQAYTLLTLLGNKGQHRIANSCKNLANAFRALKRYPEALEWAERGVQIQAQAQEKYKSLNGMRGNYKALADVYEEIGNTEAALEWNKRILMLPVVVSPYSVGVCKSILKLHAKRGEYVQAKQYATKAWEIASQLQSPKAQESAALLMAEAMGLNGEYRAAYGYQQYYLNLHDSLKSVEKGRQIARLQAMYELERQREENERLRKENVLQETIISRQTLVVAAIAMLLMLALAFTFLFYRADAQKKRANAQLQETNDELDATLRDLKETQTQLVQSERINTAGMLTAGVMHEINNPNAAVLAALHDARQTLHRQQEFFLSLLDEAGRASKKAQHFVHLNQDTQHSLEVATSGARRVQQIVANLQQFTKHQRSGEYQSALADELQSTVEIFQYQFKRVRVEFAVEGGVQLAGDFGELNQVFLNIMVNAAQAGASQIRITSALQASGVKDKKTVQIRFADDGAGMSAEESKKIFEAFYSTKGAGNSGLGLSISKHIVERHGGQLWCESNVGAGATFVVELPMSEAQSLKEQENDHENEK
jgi:signal transduction histidine kinase